MCRKGIIKSMLRKNPEHRPTVSCSLTTNHIAFLRFGCNLYVLLQATELLRHPYIQPYVTKYQLCGSLHNRVDSRSIHNFEAGDDMVDESIYSSHISSRIRKSSARYGYGSARMPMTETNAFEVDLNGIEPCDWPLFRDQKDISQSSSYALSVNATGDLDHAAWMAGLEQNILDFPSTTENHVNCKDEEFYRNVESRISPATSRHASKRVLSAVSPRTSSRTVGTPLSKPDSVKKSQQGRHLVRKF